MLSVTPTQRKGSQVPFAASVRIAGLSLVRITAVVHKKLTKVVNYSEVDETVSLTKPNCAHQENSKLLIFYLICLNPLNLKLSKIREEKKKRTGLILLIVP